MTINRGSGVYSSEYIFSLTRRSAAGVHASRVNVSSASSPRRSLARRRRRSTVERGRFFFSSFCTRVYIMSECEYLTNGCSRHARVILVFYGTGQQLVAGEQRLQNSPFSVES